VAASRPIPRPVRLVAFDMEGCLTTDPTVWEIMHRRLGTWESHGLAYWERFRAGKLDYDTFARLDVATWRGARDQLLHEAARSVQFMPGCAHVLGRLHAAGVQTAIISNGLTHLAERLQRECGVTVVRANAARVHAGHLTGELEVRVPYADKGRLLRQVAAERGVGLHETAAVGDGAADLAMFALAAVSVAVRPSQAAVARAATHVLADHDLTPLPELLGLP